MLQAFQLEAAVGNQLVWVVFFFQRNLLKAVLVDEDQKHSVGEFHQKALGKGGGQLHVFVSELVLNFVLFIGDLIELEKKLDLLFGQVSHNDYIQLTGVHDDEFVLLDLNEFLDALVEVLHQVELLVQEGVVDFDYSNLLARTSVPENLLLVLGVDEDFGNIFVFIEHRTTNVLLLEAVEVNDLLGPLLGEGVDELTLSLLHNFEVFERIVFHFLELKKGVRFPL